MNPIARPGRLVAIVVATLALASCGDDDGSGATATTTATAPTSGALDGALWPAPADARPQDTPRAVARSFVEDFVGVREPLLGAFQQGDSRSGEVPVLRRGEDGGSTGSVIATIALRQLEGSSWFVIAANSDEVRITSPEAGAELSSPVKIAGTGVGHEGNIVLRVHDAHDPKPLAEQPVIAGATQPEAFSADLTFESPRSRTGAIVARAATPLPGGDAFAALPIRFAAP